MDASSMSGRLSFATTGVRGTCLRTGLTVASMVGLSLAVLFIVLPSPPHFRRLDAPVTAPEESGSWLESFADWLASEEDRLSEPANSSAAWNSAQWLSASRGWLEDCRGLETALLRPHAKGRRWHVALVVPPTKGPRAAGNLSGSPTLGNDLCSGWGNGTIAGEAGFLKPDVDVSDPLVFEALLERLQASEEAVAQTLGQLDALIALCVDGTATCRGLTDAEESFVEDARWFVAFRRWLQSAHAMEDSAHDANFSDGLMSGIGQNRSAWQHSSLLNRSWLGPFGFRRSRGSVFVRGPGRGRGGGGACFPGASEVIVRSTSERRLKYLPIRQLQVGQEVLVESRDRTPQFEPVLGFLHFAPGANGHYRVLVHARGHFRATAEHIVFLMNAQGQRVDVPMKEVRAGDQIFTVSGPDAAIQPSRVLAVQEHVAASGGMYAPLTASGSIIVDQIIASVYAGAAAYRHGPHAAYHALFFGARAYHRAFGSSMRAPDELHPAAELFESLLGPFFRAGLPRPLEIMTVY